MKAILLGAAAGAIIGGTLIQRMLPGSSFGLFCVIVGVAIFVPFIPNLILNRFGKQFNWWVLWDRFKRKTTPAPFKSDWRWMQENTCPVCHEKDSLLGGPSGGASQNVGCANCGQHFTVTPGLGMVVRDGKMSDDRARTVFGIDPEAYVG